MAVWVGEEAAALIKMLPPDGDPVPGRVDLQHHRDPFAVQLGQRPGANALTPKLGTGSEVLHIAEALCLPEQQDTQELLPLHQQIKVVFRMAQPGRLGRPGPPLINWEADLVQGEGLPKAGVRRVCQPNPFHAASISFCVECLRSPSYTMAPHPSIPAQQIIGGHMKKVGQKDQRSGRQIDLSILDFLIMTVGAVQELPHLHLRQSPGLSQGLEPFRNTWQNNFQILHAPC